MVESGKVSGIRFAKTELSNPDESGRRRVIEVENSVETVEADIIIMALGFNPEVPTFLSENGVKTNSWGGIEISETGETSSKNIYSCGDATRGADLVVRAAFDGREIAKSILKSFEEE